MLFQLSLPLKTMGRKRNKKKIYESLEITGLSSDGFGVAKPDEKVVFVEKAIPGDIVKADVYQNRKKFEKAKVLEILTASPDRQEPFCQHFDLCGGCKLQHIPYSMQLKHKADTVENAFSRLAKVEIGEVQPIVAAEKEIRYRNKMEYTFSDAKWLTNEQIKEDLEHDRRALGLHVPGGFSKVVDIDTCYLQDEISDKIRNGLRDFAKENEIPFYNIVKKEGLLRNLIIRTTSTNQLMVIVFFFFEDEKWQSMCMEYLKTTFPEITSLHYVINSKMNDSYQDLPTHTYHGDDFVIEQLGDFKFGIRPKSFFQTNIYQAKKLYDVAKEFAGLTENDTLYDLYSGVGSIGIYLSRECKKVVGIEQIDQAVEDAKENAALNNVQNAQFEVGDVRSLLNKDFLKKHGSPDVLVTDPPRAGMHEDVVNALLKAEIPKIVYVSCNPATQSRDIALMSYKYEVAKTRAVDMFPQTMHIENVALLVLKSKD